MAPEATGLSDRQFKRKVFEELQNAGTIEGLKGNLRSRLVGVLQRRDPNVFAGSGPGQQSLWQRAANSLYVEYLASQNYTYSLSVFQPECGLTNQQVMTRDELSRVLSLGGSIASYLPKSPTTDPEPPLLLKLLQGVADMGGANTEARDADPDGRLRQQHLLALRMQQIDEMHERAVETERAAPRLRDAEERMSAFQKECEARLGRRWRSRCVACETTRWARRVWRRRRNIAARSRRRARSSSACTPSACVSFAPGGEPDGAGARRRGGARSAPPTTTASVSPPSTRPCARRRPPRSKGGCAREMRARASHRDLARREAEMASEGAAVGDAVRGALRAGGAARLGAAPGDGLRRRATPRDGHLGDGGHRGGARQARGRTRAHAAGWRRWRARAPRGGRGEAKRGRTRHATDILNIQLDDLRAQLDAARDELEKRGIPLPVSREAGGVGIGLAMNAAGASNSGPAYAQVVAAMERAKAEAAVARQEIVQRRKDLSRIKQERNSATQERNDAIREAAEWKGKCELANKMAG